ncbi:hypothetical protein X797_007050 [Metarhizium robertsii]|uniref:Uncharacterized protein n=1 Tax=Metarhizium robertsii TaxID=568076 RepID=A0A014QYS5_9HYPO|nr:hypothetical protein X797_007050 [Metarhizium robertsii]
MYPLSLLAVAFAALVAGQDWDVAANRLWLAELINVWTSRLPSAGKYSRLSLAPAARAAFSFYVSVSLEANAKQGEWLPCRERGSDLRRKLKYVVGDLGILYNNHGNIHPCKKAQITDNSLAHDTKSGADSTHNAAKKP